MPIVSCDLITNPEHCATAGLPATLEGRVTSFDGVPQPGIAITLGVNDQAITDRAGFQTVTTGADGTYNRSACCNSEFGVTVSAPGYNSQPFSGYRISGRTRYQDILMQRE